MYSGTSRFKTLAVSMSTWEEQSALPQACIAADWLPIVECELAVGETFEIKNIMGPTVVLVGTEGSVHAPRAIETTMAVPDTAQRRQWWAEALGNEAIAGLAGDVALMGGPRIQEVGRTALALAAAAKEPLALAHIAEARQQLDGSTLRLLAHPVERKVPRSSLVLPQRVGQEVDGFIARCRRRDQLWDKLGSTLAATSHSGARALFVGESGTGKTLAASVIANELSAPLYRVDLAAVMNKYIGESEKNLGRLLDLAASNDCVLLFDEADALFGRRGEGNDTGERYTNMLTNFLLTRIENHPGIVLLTANSRARVDGAFVRRLDTIIEFTLPDQTERLELWQRHLGERAPDEHNLSHLAAYADLPGGAIRNAVLAAAVASEDDIIDILHLWDAVAREYRKLGKPVPAALQRGQAS